MQCCNIEFVLIYSKKFAVLCCAERSCDSRRTILGYMDSQHDYHSFTTEFIETLGNIRSDVISPLSSTRKLKLRHLVSFSNANTSRVVCPESIDPLMNCSDSETPIEPESQSSSISVEDLQPLYMSAHDKILRLEAKLKETKTALAQANTALQLANATSNTERRKRVKAELAVTSIMDTWSGLHKGSFAEECRYGLALTVRQFEGIRHHLSSEFSEQRNRYVQRRIPNTESSEFPLGRVVPRIPNAAFLRNRAMSYAFDIGLRDCSDSRGCTIDANKVILCSIKEAGPLIDGTYQVQIIGDGHRAMKTYGIVNVCIRGIHSGAYFNALSTMNRWYVAWFYSIIIRNVTALFLFGCVCACSALLEGSESFTNTNLRKTFAMFDSVISKRGITTGEAEESESAREYIPVDIIAGGDMAYISCIGGEFASFNTSKDDRTNCTWCECTYDDLSKLPGSQDDTESGDGYMGAQTRTLRRQCWFAHLPVIEGALLPGETQFPFTCPACNISFNSMEVCFTFLEHSILNSVFLG
jgi:hypothetical protein